MNLRLATRDDAPAIAVVHRQTMRISLPYLPELHTAEDDLRYFSETFLPANTVWVAELDGVIVGYIGFDNAWVQHLYILPEYQGRKLGPALLEKALEDGRTRRLWAFQKNTRARRFYEARGFKLIQLTDGQGNEEKEPDALYEWDGA